MKPLLARLFSILSFVVLGNGIFSQIPNAFRYCYAQQEIYPTNFLQNPPLLDTTANSVFLVSAISLTSPSAENLSRIQYFKNLRVLYVDSLPDGKIPENLGKLNKLCLLSIGRSPDIDFEALIDSISQVPDFKALQLFSCGITAIPKSINKCQSLEYLSLDGNLLKDSDISTLFLPNLRYLNLSSNRLSLKKCQFKASESLVELDISLNRIKTIPKCIHNQSNLISLNLAGNRLQNIPGEISGLSKLKVLILTENPIWSLPKEMRNLVNLEDIQLIGCKFREVPTEICLLPNLVFFSMSYNKVEEFPDFLLKNLKLKSIVLESNKIRAISADFISQYAGYLNVVHNPLDAETKLLLKNAKAGATYRY